MRITRAWVLLLINKEAYEVMGMRCVVMMRVGVSFEVGEVGWWTQVGGVRLVGSGWRGGSPARLVVQRLVG